MKRHWIIIIVSIGIMVLADMYYLEYPMEWLQSKRFAFFILLVSLFILLYLLIYHKFLTRKFGSTIYAKMIGGIFVIVTGSGGFFLFKIYELEQQKISEQQINYRDRLSVLEQSYRELAGFMSLTKDNDTWMPGEIRCKAEANMSNVILGILELPVLRDDELINYRKNLTKIMRMGIDIFKSAEWIRREIESRNYGRVETCRYLDSRQVMSILYLAAKYITRYRYLVYGDKQISEDKYMEFSILTNSFDRELKDIREGVDYIHQNMSNRISDIFPRFNGKDSCCVGMQSMPVSIGISDPSPDYSRPERGL